MTRVPQVKQGSDVLADGLVGEVRVAADDTIAVHFRFGFKWDGKKAWHYCGTWPTTSLEHIRDVRDQARLGLKTGLNPNDSWLRDGVRRKDGNARLKRSCTATRAAWRSASSATRDKCSRGPRSASHGAGCFRTATLPP